MQIERGPCTRYQHQLALSRETRLCGSCSPTPPETDKTTHLIQHSTHPGFKSCHCLNYSNSGRRQCTGNQAKPRVTDSAATSNMNHALASHCHKHSVLNALVHMQLSPAEVQPTWSLMCQRDISNQFMTPAALDPQTCLTAVGRK